MFLRHPPLKVSTFYTWVIRGQGQGKRYRPRRLLRSLNAPDPTEIRDETFEYGNCSSSWRLSGEGKWPAFCSWKMTSTCAR